MNACPAAFSPRKKLPDVAPAVAYRRRLHGLGERQFRGIAERADVAGQVVEPQDAAQVAEVFEERLSVGQGGDPSSVSRGRSWR